jgi:hypothetical protein
MFFNRVFRPLQRIAIQFRPIFKRFKADEITIKYKKDKIASKRSGKKYKLKNHKGAMARWMVIGNSQFKRSLCGRSHLRRKSRAMTKVFEN